LNESAVCANAGGTIAPVVIRPTRVNVARMRDAVAVLGVIWM